MKVELLNLRRQFDELRDLVMGALERVCCQQTRALGEEVSAFEQEFAAHCEASSAVAVDSGASALHLALLALGVGSGDEVMTTPLTSPSACEAICSTGAVPVFADVRLATGAMDPTRIDDAVTKRTRVLVPVHVHGRPVDLAPIYRFAVAHGFEVIEDASEAHGAMYRGWRIGSIGILTVFRFGPDTNLGVCGQGGMVVVNDPELASKVRSLRDHGRSGNGPHQVTGLPYAMGEMEAAVLRVKLRHLDRWVCRRRALAEQYYEGLRDCPVRLLMAPAQCEASWQSLTIVTGRRDALREYLTRQGVGTGVSFVGPMHLHPALAHLGYAEGNLPKAEQLCRESLSLPIYPELRHEEFGYVVDCVRTFFGQSPGTGTEDVRRRLVGNARFSRVGDVVRAFWAPTMRASRQVSAR